MLPRCWLGAVMVVVGVALVLGWRCAGAGLVLRWCSAGAALVLGWCCAGALLVLIIVVPVINFSLCSLPLVLALIE